MEVKNLEFSFYKKEILKGLNLTAKRGEFIGILGPNGCGKSTLLKNILKIYKPKSGIITLKEKSLKEYSQKELSQILGFVPQKSQISMPLLVEDIILMGRYSHLKSSFYGYEKKDLEAVDEIMKLLNLENFKKRVAFTLSGGEFQRVILARALVGKPEMLLLDEPTSALDLNYAVNILKICKAIVKKQNIACVVVLHDLNLASLFCDKILLLKDGKVAYEGSVNELFTKEILDEIYSLKCEILEHENRPVVVAI
ncbi:MAG: ABC transporter ATP-binding protein [Campylobacter ureolyticus]|nr:ABC transporter ATP-binding protein [Campylobacter ureolyticus]MDK8322445.1 ABC transporter ATP-binding protein [Campylobacter ureolyticus]